MAKAEKKVKIKDKPTKSSKVEKKVVEKKVKVSKKEEAKSVAFDYASFIDAEIRVIEKKTKVSSGMVNRYAERVSTGVLAVDMYLDGGLVPGGWYTFSGGEQSCKSTFSMCVLASCIKAGMNSLITVSDFEGSTDAEYVCNQLDTFGLKVDPKQIFGIKDDETGEWLVKPLIRYYTPDTGEAYFDFMAMVRRALPDKVVEKDGSAYFIFENTKANAAKVKGKYDVKWFSKHNQFKVTAEDAKMQMLSIVDSYPAMMPEAQDVDDPSGALAVQARMFSDGIKRIRGGMRRKMITILGINQLRQKPMQMFGCLHGNVKIPLTDGRFYTIQHIVENRIEGEVWSYNEKTKTMESKKIIDWHYNGNSESKEDWLKFTSECPETGNGIAHIAVTRNHEVLTDRGWLPAEKVKLTDRLVSKYTTYRNGNTQYFLNGVASGDSSMVAETSFSGLCILQDYNDPEYAAWKAAKLSAHYNFYERQDSRGYDTHVARGSDFVAYGKHMPDREIWKVKFDDLSLAILYMDDGHLRTGGRESVMISIKRFKDDPQAKENIQNHLNALGFNFYEGRSDSMCLTKSDSVHFFERIRKFVPKSMQRKLPEEHQGFYEEFELEGAAAPQPVHVRILKIEAGTNRLFRNKGKYDISVEDNHNYMAGNSKNGVIVHNSPEYEPGGDALKFYCFAKDTELQTNVGMMFAPELKERLYNGENILLESLGGYLPVQTAFKVPDAPQGYKVNALGHSYIGSSRHKALFLHGDGDGKPRMGFLTLEDVVENYGQVYSMMRVHTEVTQEHIIAAHEALTIEMATLSEPDEVNPVLILELPLTADTATIQKALRMVGIISIGEEGQLRIPQAKDLLDLLELMRNADNAENPRVKEFRTQQKNAMWNYALADHLIPLMDLIREYNTANPNDLVDVTDIEQVKQLTLKVLRREFETELYSDFDAICEQDGYLEDLLQYGSDLVPMPTQFAPVDGTEFWDVCVPATGAVITNGLVSHNSDVRIRLASRAAPAGWKAEAGIVTEESVTVEDGLDRYRFIAAKTIKNKMGGIPNQQTWMRLWESDGNGQARGFDPVFDTFYYMKTVGLLAGTRNKIKFLAPCPLASTKAVNWDEFRTLINGDKKQIAEVCKGIGAKPMGLRFWCFKFITTTKGKELLKNSITKKLKTKGGAAEGDDDE